MSEELRKAAEDIRLEALDYHGHAHEYLVKAAAVLTEAAENHDRLIRERDEARARVKRLEEALPKALDGLSWSQHYLREADVKSVAVELALEAVRAALQEQSK